ncbi:MULTISPECIES: DUF4376 domain-containing protein [Pseudomonas]|jgi:hypothetical protein|uniref:Uncharacterized protein DUF4376 n=1 Tax=Pseudomonas helmanticensis TaxID=1471381 RepID=A0A4R7V497_9PSED|nr:DUF4376 domain-containing protein [Pseudomonas helmanticensis]TDV43457.1 uncharacterized protein DUF4376 [Pseudomonas helmanticensis]
MKYAVFNDDSTLQTCLIDGLHVIPDSAVKLSESLFFQITQETDGIWRREGDDIVKQPFPAVVPDYKQVVAAERYKREATGVVVEGLHIETTRDSQALIASTGLAAVLDTNYRCNFKTLTGFVEIGSAQIIVIAKAVRAHVQACFDRELSLLHAIEAGEYRDEMLAEGWPDSSPPESANLQ